MRNGLVNDQIKRQVLQALKPIATNENSHGNDISHGDLKEAIFYLILCKTKLMSKKLTIQ